MLSKNKIKFILSLARKKNRDAEQVFLAEGNKLVTEAIGSGFTIELLCGTADFLKENKIDRLCANEVLEVSAEEIKKASLLQSPQDALAVVRMPGYGFSPDLIAGEFSLALDSIQDPGNMGTIMRIADWFGIKHILCSESTVDCYNPKVIQSGMGAIFRVQAHYLELPQTLARAARSGLPVYGTFLDGENIYDHPLSQNGILVMGNEGNGISAEVAKTISAGIHIPSYPPNGQSSESLNVAVAAAICCAEFRRRLK
ncbi:TrmH family RNA methyltransferase [Gaoshiqia sp. Z1-71]|uniref:TrmH family RNA methyltransferase n=1 Tax=Gaoshiqia hydrogeniformans TaxID=3290090 RepID=UPI003BF7E8FF